MFLLPNNKDINVLERSETKNPLLQLFLRNKNKNRLSSPKTPKASSISNSHNLLFSTKNNITNNTLNIIPKKKLFSNEKPISPIYSDKSNTNSKDKTTNYPYKKTVKNHINSIAKNLFGFRSNMSSTINCKIFPVLNSNTNPVNSQKKVVNTERINVARRNRREGDNISNNQNNEVVIENLEPTRNRIINETNINQNTDERNLRTSNNNIAERRDNSEN